MLILKHYCNIGAFDCIQVESKMSLIWRLLTSLSCLLLIGEQVYRCINANCTVELWDACTALMCASASIFTHLYTYLMAEPFDRFVRATVLYNNV